MTVALELDREAQRRGLKSAFVATGQTGIMISDNGLPVDRIISDFVAGMGGEKGIDFSNKNDRGFVHGAGGLRPIGAFFGALWAIPRATTRALVVCRLSCATLVQW